MFVGNDVVEEEEASRPEGGEPIVIVDGVCDII